MVVVDLALQEGLHRVDETAAASEHAVDVVSGLVPDRQPHGAAFAVVAAEGVRIQVAVIDGRTAQQIDLVAGVEASGDRVAALVVVPQLVGVQCHDLAPS